MILQFTEGDNVQLLENEYTAEWSDFVETYLETDDCFPAFLAAVTLQLYDKQKEERNNSNQQLELQQSSTY